MLRPTKAVRDAPAHRFSRYGDARRSSIVTVPSGTATARFELHSFKVGLIPLAAAIGDLDGDGRPDVAVAAAEGVLPSMNTCLP